MSSRAHEVLWTEIALDDLVAIVTRIALDSPREALDVLSGLRTKAAHLETFPDRGRVVPELADIGVRRYRELLVSPHRVLYHREESLVYVVAVLDGRRDLEDTLLRRLLGT